MKNNPLDDIVKCTVEISGPTIGNETFDKILMIVPEPSGTGKKQMDGMKAIAGADELLDYGFETDDIAYTAATVAFSQSPAPDSIYVTVRQKDTENAYEDILLTLTRAEKNCGFYGIHITDFRDTQDLEKVMGWAEANEKIFGFEYVDYENFPVKNTAFYRTFAIFSGFAQGYDEEEQPKENKYLALAWMAKCFGYDPGTETWAHKELSSVMPSALDADMKRRLEEKNISSFLRYAGCNTSIGGKMLAGEWIDVIRFRDWIKNEMQSRVYNAIRTNKKVPFTDAGITMIEGQMIAALKKGQEVGGIVETEYDSDGNAILGYTVTVPKAYSFSTAERKSRKLTGCRYTARLTGAIHAVEIKGNLVF